MPSLGLRIVASAVLACSALLKLAAPARASSALATLGLTGSRTRWAAWGVTIAVELGLAAGVLAGSDGASYAGACLLAALAAVLAVALARGRAGQPCGCFGAASRVSRGAVVRNLLLAALL